MSVGQIISSTISGAAVLLLAWIAKAVVGVRADFRRFLAEHAWLMSTTLWSRDRIIKIMGDLGMPVGDPPPDNLPHGEVYQGRRY